MFATKNPYECLQPTTSSENTLDHHQAIADTGATDHFMTATFPLDHDKDNHDYKPIHVTMPNGKSITSTKQGVLPLKAPFHEMKAHVLPALSHSLISIGKLCDAGCTAFFDAQQVTISHHKNTILQGQRNPRNGLWQFPSNMGANTNRPITPSSTALDTTTPQANFTIHDALSKDIIKFLHLSLFSPTRATLLQAINNNHFIGWPALTAHNVKRYLPLQEATIMGHMDQQRQHARSTQVRLSPTNEPTRTQMAQTRRTSLTSPFKTCQQEGCSPIKQAHSLSYPPKESKQP